MGLMGPMGLGRLQTNDSANRRTRSAHGVPAFVRNFPFLERSKHWVRMLWHDRLHNLQDYFPLEKRVDLLGKNTDLVGFGIGLA
jgi:hypothetical protein